mgnify:CR=1 FL=1
MQEGKGGKYDFEAEAILIETGCDLVLVLALGGPKGHGFSVASRGPVIPELVAKLLRSMADDLAAGAPPTGVHFTTEKELRDKAKG